MTIQRPVLYSPTTRTHNYCEEVVVSWPEDDILKHLFLFVSFYIIPDSSVLMFLKALNVFFGFEPSSNTSNKRRE